MTDAVIMTLSSRGYQRFAIDYDKKRIRSISLTSFEKKIQYCSSLKKISTLTKMESLHVNTLIELPSVANALATDIFCEVNSSVVFRKKFSGCAGHIHFDRGMFVSGGVRQSGNFYYKLLSSDSNTLSKSYLDDIKEDKSRIK